MKINKVKIYIKYTEEEGIRIDQYEVPLNISIDTTKVWNIDVKAYLDFPVYWKQGESRAYSSN